MAYRHLHDQQQHHHRGSRRNSGIVREYTDLTTGETQLLTKIFSHAPKQRNSTIADSYEWITREQISKLPSHLRTKIPWLSSFCSLHNKINFLVVNSILEWLKDEVDTCVPAVWGRIRSRKLLNEEQLRMLSLVEELNCLWTPPESKQRRHHHRKLSAMFGYGSAKCGGCILAQIGGSEDVLVALGAFFIGRVKETIWKSSKRILWIEWWIRDAADNDEGDRAVQRMWELGVEFRELRKKASVGERSYVDQYVQHARATDHEQPRKQLAHAEPTENGDHVENWLTQVAAADDPFDRRMDNNQHEQQPAQYDRIQSEDQADNWLNQVAAADDLFDRGMDDGQYQQQPAKDGPIQQDDQADNWLNQVAAADELFDNKGVWDGLQPANQVDQSPAPVNEEQAATTMDFQNMEANDLFRPTSSVYSQVSEWSRLSSHGSESRLIDMYQHSDRHSAVEQAERLPSPPPPPPPPDTESRIFDLYRHSVYTQDGRPF